MTPEHVGGRTRRQRRLHAAARMRKVRTRVVTITVAVAAATAGVLSAAALAAPSQDAAGAFETGHVQTEIAVADMEETFTSQIVTERTPYMDITERDADIPEGVVRRIATSRDEIVEVTYLITSVGGVEHSRTSLAEVVVQSGQAGRVVEGTLPVPSRGAVTEGSTRALGKQAAEDSGWTGVQWRCLDNLWERESNWRTTAENPSSGAYGIPQSLPGSKMATHGSDWRTNPETQISWGLHYIRSRYGSPCEAWAHFLDRNWY